MDFQISEDSAPSEFISEEQRRQLVGRPAATGAWLVGDPVGQRKFSEVFSLDLESGQRLDGARIAYESWGELNKEKSNAILVLHALTGDSHTSGDAGPGHPTAGWWNGLIGPGLSLDTNEFYVITPNVLGGCQGSTGPSSLDVNGREYGPSFPQLTIRDQAEAIRSDHNFAAGWYYDAKAGFGPHKGLALARRMALLNYRSPAELNERFGRTWQSQVSPLTERGKFAVESYLDFHGNKFVRRFDANSYITLVNAMNSYLDRSSLPSTSQASYTVASYR